jgi:hypothetical protein
MFSPKPPENVLRGWCADVGVELSVELFNARCRKSAQKSFTGPFFKIIPEHPGTSRNSIDIIIFFLERIPEQIPEQKAASRNSTTFRE